MDAEYGSFHHHYRIDGVLVAVGVVDILPSCLSSVYFFYDPAYHHLSLGVWSALQEIEWVKRFSATHPECHYYAMGFYIHSCPKMRYKAQFFPSQLLCSERYTWHSLDVCFPYLDQHNYVVFSDVAPPFEPPQRSADQRTGEKRAKADATPGPLPASSALSTASVHLDPKTYTVSAQTVAEVKRKRSVHTASPEHVPSTFVHHC